MRSGVSVFLLCALALAAGAAEEWRDIPYADLHEVFSRDLAGGAKYARVRQTLTVNDESFHQADLRLVVAAAAGPIEVTIADDGTVDDFPVSAALLEENPPVRTNAPEDKLMMTIVFSSTVAPAERLPYAVIVEMADEYDALVRRQGLMARMMMPDPKGLVAAFGPGVDAHARVGDEVIEADADGNLTIPLTRKWRRDPPEVEFSTMPLRLTLSLE